MAKAYLKHRALSNVLAWPALMTSSAFWRASVRGGKQSEILLMISNNDNNNNLNDNDKNINTW